MKLTIEAGFLRPSREVDPAVVGPQLGVAVGDLVELAPRRVERRDAGVAAAGQVDGREVERQAEQVVAQRAGDELVDLVADLAGHAADDRAGRLPRAVGRSPSSSNAERVEEALDQADVRRSVAVGVEAVDRLGQHRVAEAVDDVGELGDDRRVDRRVVAAAAPGTRRCSAGSCGRTPRRRGAGTASRCRTAPPGTAARRSTASASIWPVVVGTAATSTRSHSFRKASRSVARTVALVCSTSRLCSAWNTWWTAVRPMFSLPRPSPVMKCASSSSLS